MRTVYCGKVSSEDIGKTAVVAGWMHSRRDHGGVIFLDLRDREGVVQVVAHPTQQPQAFEAADLARPEFVLEVTGEVRRRPKGSENSNISTGEVEIAATRISIIAESATPPFPIEDNLQASEETRIRYRYLDLRRPEMQSILALRHRVAQSIRSYFDGRGFLEVETPMLTRSTPEGARDFVVPSRLQPGTFFALPQSPQLFKQLLMIGGVDKYFQLARCFRDEDPRADRHIEFTQIDVEMAFVDEDDVRREAEGVFARIFRDAVGVELKVPFPELTFHQAMNSYGSDKPDMRFTYELVDVTDALASTAADVLRKALEAGGIAKALNVKGQAGMSRKDLGRLDSAARAAGAKGLATIAFEESGISSRLAKAFSEEDIGKLRDATGVSNGDLLVFVCDSPAVAMASMGAVRLEVADLLSLRPDHDPRDPESWKFVWVTDFPLFEYVEEESRWESTHHPFTAPKRDHEELLDGNPGEVTARHYDIVLNGWELGTGSIRINRPELQRKVFDLIGLSPHEAQRRFGWFLEAFEYGAPPHGGIACGFDRIVAMLAGKPNLREAMAFPKTGAYTDPLTGSPADIDPGALKLLGLEHTEE